MLETQLKVLLVPVMRPEKEQSLSLCLSVPFAFILLCACSCFWFVIIPQVISVRVVH